MRTAIARMKRNHVKILAGTATLNGELTLPSPVRGVVLFAHGSGSSHLSPRNRHVAQSFQKEGFATLLFDLLTREEESLDMITGELRFNIDLLSRRLDSATDWARQQPDTSPLVIGYFGASTGAAAALVAASRHPTVVKAIVSRGGRPDLAGEALPKVSAPTLLIVGGEDTDVIEMNRAAATHLRAHHNIEIVPGATHLFEEPGKLDEVARLATRWFDTYLIP